MDERGTIIMNVITITFKLVKISTIGKLFDRKNLLVAKENSRIPVQILEIPEDFHRDEMRTSLRHKGFFPG